MKRRHLTNEQMAARLTFYQRQVMYRLANLGSAAITDWGAWYPIPEGTVRGVIWRLANKGLVDVAGWTDSGRGREARTYCLTSQGSAVCSLLETEDLEAEEETLDD
jgi:predicted ArsR family transcriptional regulator